MMHQEITTLRTQLTEVLSEPHGYEHAVLAGLLYRLAPDDPRISLVDRGLTDPVVPTIAKAAERGLALIEGVEEEDDPALSWNALCALDEACAASWLVASPALVEEAVADAVALVRAFPTAFACHAVSASGVLADRRPRPGDPALSLWAAVEASAFGIVG